MSDQPGSIPTIPDTPVPSRPSGPIDDRVLPLIREALLLNDDAYRVMRNHGHPLRRDALVLMWIVLIAAFAHAIGLAFGLLTTSRIDLIQQTIFL